jgi:hypothetical protein
MSKTLAVHYLRSRPSRVRLGMLVSFTFLATLFLHCMCGPFCNGEQLTRPSYEQVATSERCCSSCTPNEQHKPTHSNQGNCACCLIEIQYTETAQTICDSDFSAPVRSAVRIVFMKLPHETMDRNHTRTPITPSSDPPAYLRFEAFLI